MKNRFLQYLTILSLSTSASMVHGIALSTNASINWGDAVFSTLIDSTGLSDANLDSGYSFQLGVFEGAGGASFTPDGDNLAEWELNWQVFDQAEFNPVNGHFAGGFDTDSIMSGADGTSLSPDATAGFSFSNKNAYIMIFNTGSISGATEMFLARMSSWIFPDAANFLECCGTDYDQQWSISSDYVDGVDVVYGGYTDTNPIDPPITYTGAGSYDQAVEAFHIQTHTTVPEFSTLVQTVAMIGTSLFYIVGRRKKGQYS